MFLEPIIMIDLFESINLLISPNQTYIYYIQNLNLLTVSLILCSIIACSLSFYCITISTSSFCISPTIHRIDADLKQWLFYSLSSCTCLAVRWLSFSSWWLFRLSDFIPCHRFLLINFQHHLSHPWFQCYPLFSIQLKNALCYHLLCHQKSQQAIKYPPISMCSKMATCSHHIYCQQCIYPINL